MLFPRRFFGTFGSFKLPEIKNEPFKHYAIGSPERAGSDRLS